ncbi:hypothetical protein [Paludisphaera rhizosphaerae]|uniref:hypothetical protein n=1 Tax=Paludisphaera rhizosphaerae TaxID=2711216 RepID=UPI0013EE1DD4|nr:hypothetical protein [Paludisphaera rhizosphaerae]
MAIGKRRIQAELAMLALIVASLGGALHLVVSIHRQSLLDARKPQTIEVVNASPAAEPAPIPQPPPKVVKKPRPTVAPSPPQPVPEDPTPKALAQISEATARERAEAQRLDREAASLEAARKKATAESEGWRRREMLVKTQIAQLEQKSNRLDREVDAFAAQRDVLVQERDALKAAIAKAPGEGSYAVLPYQGENGTWKRPIVIECTSGAVTIKPNGPTFNMTDLAGIMTPRSSPVVVAIARELLKVKTAGSPDGSPVVPYFVFLVRPDGVRAYYEIRSRLEPLGIAFGYELVEQNLDIHVPNYDDLATWDGSPSISVPSSGLAGSPAGSTGSRTSGGTAKPGSGEGLSWPGNDDARTIAQAFNAGRGGKPVSGGNGSNAGTESPGDFVWPTSRPGLGAVGRQGAEGQQEGPPGGPMGAGGTTRGGSGSRPAGSGGVGAIGGDDWLRGPYGTGRNPSERGPAENGDEPGTLADEILNLQRRGDAGGLQGAGIPPSGIARGADGGRPANAGAGESTRRPGTTAGQGLARRSGSGNQLEAPKSTTGAFDDNLQPAPAGGSGTESPQSMGGLMWGGGASNGPPAGSAQPATGENSEGARGSSARSNAAGGMTPPANASGNPPRSVTSMPRLAGLGSGMGSPIGLGSSNSQPSPGLMIGADSESGRAGSGGAPGASASADPEMKPLIPNDEEKPETAVEIPFEIVVACGTDGLTIQPGGYRITNQALRTRRDEDLFVRNLEAVARKRAEVDPGIRPRPRVKFLVEEDGAQNFWEARRQILFSGLNWPMSLQVAGAQNPRFLEQGVW